MTKDFKSILFETA